MVDYKTQLVHMIDFVQTDKGTVPHLQIRKGFRLASPLILALNHGSYGVGGESRIVPVRVDAKCDV